MAEVVDLCDTPEREHRLSIEPTAKKRRTLDGASACDPKDNVIDLCASASDADDDDGVVEVHAENARRSASAVCQMNAGPSGDDGDIEITAASGAFANADFPHARENCAIHPMTPGSESSHCPLCHCYVCDARASSCPEWHEHCAAKHREPRWKAARSAWRKRVPPAPAAPAPVRAPVPVARAPSAPRPGPSASVAPAGPRTSAPTSCSALLEHVQQVYPEEAPAPRGLANCLLRPYQKQSLAFMLNLEKASAADSRAPRGGWLCDEVGMGKTATCIALMLANPSSIRRASDADYAQLTRAVRSASTAGDRVAAPAGNRRPFQLKATVVLCPPSIVGQWVDEIAKFAPGLAVRTWHPGFKTHSLAAGDLRDADVIVMSPFVHILLRFGKLVSVHRLIFDEIHEVNRGHLRAEARYYWGVTGTPCTSAVSQLVPQAERLSLCPAGWSPGTRTVGCLTDGDAIKTLSEAELVRLLRQVMIRHTKAQRIGGSEALSLPPASVETVWLTMSADESELYRLMKQQDPRELPTGGARFSGMGLRGVSNRYFATQYVYTPLMHGDPNSRPRCLANLCGADRALKPDRCTKVRALLDDLTRLRAKEPGVHAVVFSQNRTVCEAVISSLRAQRFDVCTFDGSVDAGVRARTIREFQLSAEQRTAAKVFVITLRTGAVGITLTAASRVYLMEPCLDPAVELQAAGRIHRLGQTKQVLIKRFAFSGTVEERICELHKEIHAGRAQVVDRHFTHAMIKKLASM